LPQLSGIGCKLQLDDAGGSPQDLSTDIFDFSGDTTRGQWDITALQDLGMRRLLLLADCTFQFTGVINTEANHTHDVFKTVPSDASTVLRSMILDLPPATTGAAEFTAELSVHSYSPRRQQNGQMGFTAAANNGDGSAPSWGTMS
jgi:hypothetical protein